MDADVPHFTSRQDDDPDRWTCLCGETGTGGEEQAWQHRRFHGDRLLASMSDADLATVLAASIEYDTGPGHCPPSATLAVPALLDHGGWIPRLRQCTTLGWIYSGMLYARVRWTDLAAPARWAFWTRQPMDGCTSADTLFLQFLVSLTETLQPDQDTTISLHTVATQVPQHHRVLLASAFKRVMMGRLPADAGDRWRLDQQLTDWHRELVEHARASLRGEARLSLAALREVPPRLLVPLVGEVSAALTSHS